MFLVKILACSECGKSVAAISSVNYCHRSSIIGCHIVGDHLAPARKAYCEFNPENLKF